MRQLDGTYTKAVLDCSLLSQWWSWWIQHMLQRVMLRRSSSSSSSSSTETDWREWHWHYDVVQYSPTCFRYFIAAVTSSHRAPWWCCTSSQWLSHYSQVRESILLLCVISVSCDIAIMLVAKADAWHAAIRQKVTRSHEVRQQNSLQLVHNRIVFKLVTKMTTCQV